MHGLKRVAFAVIAGVAAFAATAAAPTAQAQIGISIGGPPICPYGYYDFAPYSCSPYGYYGPEWFNGGVFIGAGRWFHGPANFHGHVDSHFDTRRGYRGPVPHAGERADPNRRMDAAHFHGSESHDAQGHADSRGGGGHGAPQGHAQSHGGGHGDHR